MIPPRAGLELDPSAVSERLRSPSPPVLVDVREDWEVQLAPMPGAVHIPLRELPARAPEELSASVETVVVCHHGIRSLQGALVLRGLGFSSAWSLRGGTDLWARTVDPSVRRY
ncbi:MAG: rhodanese-like domain-containing protein [Myxococcota bacterium]